MKQTTIEAMLQPLEQQPFSLIQKRKRGVEREGLRVSSTSHSIAASTHPTNYGSKLTHPHITTDYAESLLEIITAPHDSVAANLQELSYWHQVVLEGLPSDEYLWGYSMPCSLPDDSQIPIAYYGTSNEAQMKSVYREGLALRYGKHMQCIAGLHYNFSLPAEFWQFTAHAQQKSADIPAQNMICHGYMHLIRNVIRHASCLLFLLGASPVVHQSFNATVHGARSHGDMLLLPYATSLRMSDIGYQSAEQKRWLPRWSDLTSYIEDLFHIVSEPSEVFSRLGLLKNGQRVQLNTNRLQLENEFYAPIRPKAIAQNERPLMALWNRGIEYVELRCVDIDPFAPLGISSTTSCFLEVFMTWCALAPQAPLNSDTCTEIRELFAAASQKGRDPNLQVQVNGQSIRFHDWVEQLLVSMQPVAQYLDRAHHGSDYQTALQVQIDKARNPDQTPSARVLHEVQSVRHLSDWVYANAQQHQKTLQTTPLSTAEKQQALLLRDESMRRYAEWTAAPQTSLDEYLEAYDQQLNPLRSQFLSHSASKH